MKHATTQRRSSQLAVLAVSALFAASAAAAPLVCTDAVSANVAVPQNTWVNIDANCPAGYSATGGGYVFNEGSGGVIGIWAMSIPNGNGWRTWVVQHNPGVRHVQTYVRCCRTP